MTTTHHLWDSEMDAEDNPTGKVTCEVCGNEPITSLCGVCGEELFETTIAHGSLFRGLHRAKIKRTKCHPNRKEVA